MISEQQRSIIDTADELDARIDAIIDRIGTEESWAVRLIVDIKTAIITAQRDAAERLLAKLQSSFPLAAQPSPERMFLNPQSTRKENHDDR